MGAKTYKEWKQQALAKDARLGLDKWKAKDHSSRYDYKVIRRRLDELRGLRSSGNVRGLIYYMNEGIHGNMGGIGAPALYRRANFGTKKLIVDYVTELSKSLALVGQAEDGDFLAETKAEFFRRVTHAWGQGALMLSGAGSLGPFHLGVAKALWEQNVLPNVISGASAGSIVAAILCTNNDRQLEDLLKYDKLSGTFRRVSNDQTGLVRKRLSPDDLREIIETWIPDVTFAEALEISGRQLNVPLAPSEMHQQSRTVNAVIAPNLLVREAVLASSSIPGLFPAVRLLSRTADGKKQPYVNSRRWVDGSVTDDMPASRLTRMYGCNFFIASQINPFVIWALQDPNSQNPYIQFTSNYRSSIQQFYRVAYPYAMQAVKDIYPFNVMTRLWYGIATQDYTADVNIMPGQRFRDPTTLLHVLSAKEAHALVTEGERAAWPRLERIRISSLVSRTLNGILAEVDRIPFARAS